MSKILRFKRKQNGLASARPKRARPRLFSSVARYRGFVALAVLLVGTYLNQDGYLHPRFTIAKRLPERFSAMAIDGDTLRIAGTDIRLMGIDAPELHQGCREKDGAAWPCGREAHAFLRGIVSRGLLSCRSSSTDHYGRALATCSVGDVGDIGDAMVRAGFAVSYRTFGYWPAELEARRHKRGIWRGTFDRPQDWRRKNSGN